ncbi:kinetochore protein Mis14 like-domain-containing protein [Dipodascopsis uninucleata]
MADFGRGIPDFQIQQLHHPPVHQKLQLVSQDIKYLREKFLEAAREKINSHFPQPGDQILKAQTAKIVDEFVNNMFESAKYSFIVNGLDGSDPSLKSLFNGRQDKDNSENYEPFDLDLNEKVRELYAQIDEETVEVTKLRREVPKEVLEKYKAELDNIDKDQRGRLQTSAAEENALPNQSIEELIPDHDFIKNDFDSFIKVLREMKSEISSTVSKADQAEEALKYLRSSNGL